jgi:hypothetical protein
MPDTRLGGCIIPGDSRNCLGTHFVIDIEGGEQHGLFQELVYGPEFIF